MKQTRRGSPGRRKRQAAKLLDPASKDWWQNMDVNVFGSDAKHPWLDLACAVKTIQLQDEEDRRAGAPTRNQKWRSQKLDFLQKELGNRGTKAALDFDGGLFRSFGLLLDYFKRCKQVPPADPVRTVLMIYHKVFKLIHGIAPGYRDLWEVIWKEGKNVAWIPRKGQYDDLWDVTFDKGKEFPWMDESQLRRTCTKMGLSLTSERFMQGLEKAYVKMKSQLKRPPTGAEFKKVEKHFAELADLTPAQLDSLCDRLPHRVRLRKQSRHFF
jgi:hypothetical protein